jgi:hypothetical protein
LLSPTLATAPSSGATSLKFLFEREIAGKGTMTVRHVAKDEDGGNGLGRELKQWSWLSS